MKWLSKMFLAGILALVVLASVGPVLAVHAKEIEVGGQGFIGIVSSSPDSSSISSSSSSSSSPSSTGGPSSSSPSSTGGPSSSSSSSTGGPSSSSSRSRSTSVSSSSRSRSTGGAASSGVAGSSGTVTVTSEPAGGGGEASSSPPRPRVVSSSSAAVAPGAVEEATSSDTTSDASSVAAESYTEVLDEEAPLVRPTDTSGWSLFNLLVTLLCVFFAILFAVMGILRKKGTALRYLFSLLGLVPVIVLLLTTRFAGRMFWFDSLSVWYGVTTILYTAFLVFVHGKSRNLEAEHEDEV